MALPGGVGVLAPIAVCIIGVGVLLHLVGLATPQWSARQIMTILCHSVFGKNVLKALLLTFVKADALESSIKACEAFAILGMLASVLGLAMAAISVLFPMMRKPKNALFPVISSAACVVSFICILVAIIVWDAKVHKDYFFILDLGYSFILSITGGILIVIGGALAFVANKMSC